ncbi:MAG: hypothetical protein VSS75_009230 [Candidatus Parabeggiatoa sp.]|nr:hypothetical protein [Candidatus Parabeggiatoa sp.]
MPRVSFTPNPKMKSIVETQNRDAKQRREASRLYKRHLTEK